MARVIIPEAVGNVSHIKKCFLPSATVRLLTKIESPISKDDQSH